MTSAQRRVVIVCSVVAVVMLVLVPVGRPETYGRIVPKGYEFIFMDNDTGYVVNYIQLVLQLLILVGIGTGAFFLGKGK